MAIEKVELKRVRDIATYYRSVVLLIGLQWLAAGFSNGQRGQPEGSAGLAVIAGLVALACTVFLVEKAYRLAQALGYNPIVVAVGVVVPIINLFMLLGLSRKCTAVCKSHGIRVGLLGPNLADVEKLENAAQSGAAAS